MPTDRPTYVPSTLPPLPLPCASWAPAPRTAPTDDVPTLVPPRYQVRSFGYAYVVDTHRGNLRLIGGHAFKTWDEALALADKLNEIERVS